MAVWKRYRYKCNNTHCRATDSLVMLGDDPAPPIVQCYKCHNGYNKSGEQQMMGKLGMSRTEQEPEVWESGGYSESEVGVDLAQLAQTLDRTDSATGA